MRLLSQTPEQNKENRKRFFTAQGVDPERVTGVELEHGTNIRVVSHDTFTPIVSKTDALLTKEKNIFLSVTVADCLPVFFYDPSQKIVALAHAGWKGITRGVIKETLDELEKNGAERENIFVAFGPHIQRCHFEIQSDILPLFQEYEDCIVEKDGKIFVDLQSIVKKQLLDVGIKVENIETATLCTFCEKDRFFSYRRDKPEDIEAMVAVIGMK